MNPGGAPYGTLLPALAGAGTAFSSASRSAWARSAARWTSAASPAAARSFRRTSAARPSARATPRWGSAAAGTRAGACSGPWAWASAREGGGGMCGRADPGSCEVGTGGGGTAGAASAGDGRRGRLERRRRRRGRGLRARGRGRDLALRRRLGRGRGGVAAGFSGTTSLMSSGCFCHRLAEFHLELLARRELFHQRLLLSRPRAHLRDVGRRPPRNRGQCMRADAYVARRGARVTTRRADRDRPPQGTLERLLSPSGARRAASPAAARGQTAACEKAIAINRTRRRATRTPSRARRGSASALDPAATVRNPPSLPQRKRVADVPKTRAASPPRAPRRVTRPAKRRDVRSASRARPRARTVPSRPRRPVRRGVVGCASAPRDGRYGKADTIRRRVTLRPSTQRRYAIF